MSWTARAQFTASQMIRNAAKRSSSYSSSSSSSSSSRWRAAAATAGGASVAAAAWLHRGEDDDEVPAPADDMRRTDAEESCRSFARSKRFESVPVVAAAATTTTTTGAPCACEGGVSFFGRVGNLFGGRTGSKRGSAANDGRSSRERLESRYKVDWEHPIGEGNFGAVFKGVDKRSGDAVAVKRVCMKASAGDESFQREMKAMQSIRKHGGHPNICGLHSYYDDDSDHDKVTAGGKDDDGAGDYFYLVLDYVGGGEMFDHLCTHGPYSEADAARLVREVSSALAFLHGMGIVHGDLKPENLMLSSEKSSAATLKLVDFGSATVTQDDDDDDGDVTDDGNRGGGGGDAGRTKTKHHVAAATPAYSPPEFLDQSNVQKEVNSSFDMWALGVIVYIMLTGVHPFDLRGRATDDEIEEEIRSGHRPPTRSSPLTAHLSGHAIRLLERLLEWEPGNRLTALELLQDPWVQGKTARQKKMANSDKRLSAFRTFKTKLEAKVFADMISGGTGGTTGDRDGDEVSKRTSLIEQAFRALDTDNRGYVTTKELQKIAPQENVPDSEDGKMTLSGFSDLLSDSMKNRYFPKGHIVYREGEKGRHMYFIDSGTISVETSGGSIVTRGPGDFFGEGALLHPTNTRSATIRCRTPVHAMEISQEYFEKYIRGSGSDLYLELKEKDKIRKRNRAKMILRAQNGMRERVMKRGEFLFRRGESTDSIFLMEEGKADIVVGDQNVFTATPGNLTGEYSALVGRPRNCSAVCASPQCKFFEMTAKDFRVLLEVQPGMKQSLLDLCYRRDFKKAVVHRLKKEFPYRNPREAFDACKNDFSNRDVLTMQEITTLMREFSDYTDEEIREMFRTVRLTGSGNMSFEEFAKIFVGNIKTAASI